MIAKVGNSIQLTKGGAATNLSGSDVGVSRLDFYIRPVTPGDQVLVTFVFEIFSNTGNLPGETVTLNIQSSAAVRDY